MPPPRRAVQQLRDRLQLATRSAAALRATLAQLQRQFERFGMLDELYEHLRCHLSLMFERLDLAADFVIFAHKLGRSEELVAEFLRRKDGGELNCLRWDSNFAPGWLLPVNPTLAYTFLDMKYEGVPLEYGNREAALDIIASRIIIDPKLETALFAMREDQGVELEPWRSELRRSFALDHMMHDTLEGPLKLDPSECLDFQDFVELGEKFSNESLLILIYHGGYIQLLKLGYEAAFPTGCKVQSTPSLNERQFSTKDDKFGALFGALRALKSGGTVLIAPDYWIGESDFSIEVAGQRHAVAGGAPFLAFEANCRVLWLDLVREGIRLKPRLLDVVKRTPGESLQAFSVRFYEAYSAKIAMQLQGPPENIVLRHRWARFIAQGNPQGEISREDHQAD